MYDVIIIGGGPAGLTAGIYCLRANLRVLILEGESIGGQIATSPKVENYPGFTSISGIELANNLYEQVEALGGEFEFENAIKIIPGDIKEVITEYSSYKARSVIIATGARHRILGLERELELAGSGISYCATCDGAFFKDKIVAVIGGANTAITNAIYLSNICKRVYLIYRGDNLRCDESLKDKLKSLENIEIIYKSNVVELKGDKELESIIILRDGSKEELKLDGMFISIGMDANTTLADNLIDKTSDGYIDSSDTKTREAGIFVAGDCRSKSVRQLTTATSDGTIAAMETINYLSKE